MKSNRQLAETKCAHESAPVRGYSERAGKSLFARDCEISERTKAGMARAKAKGIEIDRPKIGVELRPLKWNLKKLHGAFKSLR